MFKGYKSYRSLQKLKPSAVVCLCVCVCKIDKSLLGCLCWGSQKAQTSMRRLEPRSSLATEEANSQVELFNYLQNYWSLQITETWQTQAKTTIGHQAATSLCTPV